MLKITIETKKVETQYVCPNCEKEDSFIGISAPISCGHCNRLLPDILEMIYNELERKNYHLGRMTC
ncbi:MAG: hypothetical protein E3J47_08260 [Candidatus Stahlbacteria bacterium]|nr:MAG: hypothetical protein E3J47_08260 [Candidatus Stahlbacteria bacterium]